LTSTISDGVKYADVAATPVVDENQERKSMNAIATYKCGETQLISEVMYQKHAGFEVLL